MYWTRCTPMIILILSIFLMQEGKQIDELRMELQELYQAYESTQTELQSFKSEYKNLFQEKVWFMKLDGLTEI